MMSKNIITTKSGLINPIEQKSLVESLGSAFSSAFKTSDIQRPVIDPSLSELPIFERISEVLRYKILMLEFELSSNGGLRAYIKLMLITSFFLGIPAILVVPIITSILGQFVTWSAFLLQTVQNILYTILSIVAMMVCFWLLIHVIGRRH